jgi:hypothetical protein
MHEPVSLDARASVSTYVVFGLIFGIICGSPITIAISTMRNGQSVHNSLVIALFSLLFLLVVAWIKKFRVLIRDSMVSYTTLFGGTRELNLSDIKSARTEIGPQKLLGPFYRLVLEPVASSGKPPLVINMKVFSKKDLQLVIAVLADRIHGEPQYSVFRKK